MSERGLQEKYETDWCTEEMPTLEKKLMKGKRNVVAGACSQAANFKLIKQIIDYDLAIACRNVKCD